MASVYDLKPKFQNVLRPICKKLAARGVTANQVTVGACLLSVAVGLLLIQNPSAILAMVLLPVTLFVRMALNAIDGMLAREHGQASRLGAVLNELCDVISDVVLYAGFAWIPGVSAVGIAWIVGLGALVEFQGVLAQALAGTRAYHGPFGKSDRALFFGLIAIALGMGLHEGWINLALVLAVVLSLITLAHRVKAAGV